MATSLCKHFNFGSFASMKPHKHFAVLPITLSLGVLSIHAWPFPMDGLAGSEMRDVAATANINASCSLSTSLTITNESIERGVSFFLFVLFGAISLLLLDSFALVLRRALQPNAPKLQVLRAACLLFVAAASFSHAVQFLLRFMNPTLDQIASAANTKWLIQSFSLSYGIGAAASIVYMAFQLHHYINTRNHYILMLLAATFLIVTVVSFAVYADDSSQDFVRAQSVVAVAAILRMLVLVYAARLCCSGKTAGHDDGAAPPTHHQQGEASGLFCFLASRDGLIAVVWLSQLGIAVSNGGRQNGYFLDPFVEAAAYVMTDAFALHLVLRVLGTVPSEEQSLCGSLVSCWRRLSTFMPWRKQMSLFLLYSLAGFLFAIGAHQMCFSAMGAALGVPALIARGAAFTLYLSPLLLLEHATWLITWCACKGFYHVLPLPYLRQLHNHLGRLTFVAAAVHMAGHVALYSTRRDDLEKHGLSWDKLQYPWATGFAAFGLLSLPLISLLLQKGISHEWYLRFHRGGTLAIPVTVIHGLMGRFGFPWFWLPSGLVAVALVANRYCSKAARPVVCSLVRAIPCTNVPGNAWIMEVELRDFSAEPGSFVVLSFPSNGFWGFFCVSRHPFTVVSSGTAGNGQNFIRLMMLAKGDWTTALRNEFTDGARQAAQQDQREDSAPLIGPQTRGVDLMAEGPFWAPTQQALQLDWHGFLLVAGSIGMTTAIAVIHRLIVTDDARPFHFVYSTADEAALQELGTFIAATADARADHFPDFAGQSISATGPARQGRGDSSLHIFWTGVNDVSDDRICELLRTDVHGLLGRTMKEVEITRARADAAAYNKEFSGFVQRLQEHRRQMDSANVDLLRIAVQYTTTHQSVQNDVENTVALVNATILNKGELRVFPEAI